MKCAVCKSEGFEPSVTGEGCSFCDGTEGGNPPKLGSCELDYNLHYENAGCKGTWREVVTVDMAQFERDVAANLVREVMVDYSQGEPGSEGTSVEVRREPVRNNPGAYFSDRNDDPHYRASMIDAGRGHLLR